MKYLALLIALVALFLCYAQLPSQDPLEQRALATIEAKHPGAQVIDRAETNRFRIYVIRTQDQEYRRIEFSPAGLPLSDRTVVLNETSPLPI